jgi:hypothetical protein
MINEEGKRRIEELKKEWVITKEEKTIVREQRLLANLYECQQEMEHLLDDGSGDPHYRLMGSLINRLEKHLGNQQDIM